MDRGPKPDIVEFPRVMGEALGRHRLRTVIGDAGYESERAHVLCREELGLESIFPTTVRGKKRRDGRPRATRGRWRRRLKQWFPRRRYGQRWQIETVFSMVKRNLGSALRARKPFSINREVALRVVVHNLMILKRHKRCSQRSIYVPGIPGNPGNRTGIALLPAVQRFEALEPRIEIRDYGADHLGIEHGALALYLYGFTCGD